MNKLLLVGLAVAFVVIVSTGLHETILGAVTKSTQTCTDNDANAYNSINGQGMVIVTLPSGEKQTFTDACIDENTVREYSCNPSTHKQTYSELPCPKQQVCKLGRCWA